MTGMWHDDLHARFQEQFEVVRAALAKADRDNLQRLPGIAIAKEPLGTRRDLDVLYQDCGILVRPEFCQKAKSQLGAVDADADGDDSRNPFRLLKLPEPGARTAIETFHARNGDGTAGHNFILSITDGTGNICPASEPLPARPGQFLSPPDGEDYSDVRIRVIDTGIIPDVVTLHGVSTATGQLRLQDQDPTGLAPITEAAPGNEALIGGRPRNVDGLEPLDEDLSIYYGHGTFIAGILHGIAPNAHIYVTNLLRRGGAVTMTGIVGELWDILDEPEEKMPHIISLSAGGYFSERSLPLMTDVVGKLQERAATRGYPILVAAAGNDGHNGEGPCHQPFYPAALEDVISVGALRGDNGGRACFSNHGSWVKVYAPGERIVSWFPSGNYSYHHNGTSACRYLQRRRDPEWYHCCTCVTQPDKYETKTFDGLAEWSGTSFSTPMVAGLIARQMVDGRQSAHQAAATVLAEQTRQIGGLGNILVPTR